MPSTVSMTLASPCLVMISSTEGSRLNQPAERLLRTLAVMLAIAGQADHGAVDGFHHDRIVVGRGAQLIVDADGGGALPAVEGAERADRIGIGDGGAHRLPC